MAKNTSHTSTQRTKYFTIILCSLLAVIFVVVGSLAYTTSRPPRSVPVSAPPVGVANHGGGGDGGSSQLTLPSDFPSALPLPAGTLTGSTGVSPNWSVGLNMGGAYADVMASLRPFYIGNNFKDLNPTAVVPTRFEDAGYVVIVVGRSHDHSNTSTDVVIEIQKK